MRGRKNKVVQTTWSQGFNGNFSTLLPTRGSCCMSLRPSSPLGFLSSNLPAIPTAARSLWQASWIFWNRLEFIHLYSRSCSNVYQPSLEQSRALRLVSLAQTRRSPLLDAIATRRASEQRYCTARHFMQPCQNADGVHCCISELIANEFASPRFAITPEQKEKRKRKKEIDQRPGFACMDCLISEDTPFANSIMILLFHMMHLRCGRGRPHQRSPAARMVGSAKPSASHSSSPRLIIHAARGKPLQHTERNDVVFGLLRLPSNHDCSYLTT